MNGLILFLGESFRWGQQCNRNRGSLLSYDEQMKACKSHIDFIENIKTKFSINSISVFLSSYTTQFDKELLKNYEKYLIGYKLYPDVIGIDNLFHNSINEINENIEKYDFILFIRIDLFLKDKFKELFNPNIDMILFPTICWKHDSKSGNDPKVNDLMLFVPKKYYKYITNITIHHHSWYYLMQTTDLTYNDIDTIIHTYHDSDSFKDYNPLYYIVNRPETNIFHSEGYIFDKYSFN